MSPAPLPIAAFAADLYLEAIPRSDRRARGQVYTPEHLATFVLDEAGYAPSQPIERSILLDPACGGGAFLESAVERLAQRLESVGSFTHTVRGRQRLLDAVERSLHGVDVDVEACALARQAVRDAVLRIAPGPLPLPFFEANVVAADFLFEVERVAPGRFDFVVGNPPYVSVGQLDTAYKASLRRSFDVAVGRIDLYCVFLERAIESLVPGGQVAFVLPEKFLTSQSASAAREYVTKHTRVGRISTFRTHRIFNRAATVPCVVAATKAYNPASRSDSATFEAQQCVDDVATIRVSLTSRLPRKRLSSTWDLAPPELFAIAERLRTTAPPLRNVVHRLSAGLATGRDGIFIVPPTEQDGIEPELLRDVVRGRDVAAFKLRSRDERILLPYRSSGTGSCELVDLNDFPGARGYFDRHKEALLSRHCVRVWGKSWWDVHDPVSPDLWSAPKVVVPDLAREARFAVDETGAVPAHSVYYMILREQDPWYVAAVLNSIPVQFLVRLASPLMKDLFVRYRRQFLIDLPIPVATADTQAEVANLARSGATAEVERFVERLFDLERGDRAAIGAYLSRAVRAKTV